MNARDANGATPLIRAVQQNQAASVRFLIAKGAALDSRDDQGYTALMWAAHGGSADAAQALLSAKADPAFQTELDDLLTNYAGRPTPLYFAERCPVPGFSFRR